MTTRFGLPLAAVAAVVLAGCQVEKPQLSTGPTGFPALAGWAADNVAAAIPAFLRSCATLQARGAAEPLDSKIKGGDFGTVGEWRDICAQAARLGGGDSAARAFFETNFAPVAVGDHDGLFTGYYEIALNGSRVRQGKFQTPLYRRPPDPKAYSHAEIARGALAGRGLELCWVDDPIAAYFLQIQGSGVVDLAGGGMMRLGYDSGNGRPYVAIGRLLVERGEVALKDMTMAVLLAWIASHGEAGLALMRENPSYVFFKEIGEGPLGTEGVVLTAQRSLAVDRDYIPLGVPLWLDARERFAAGVEHRLVIAQDTGGAIKGPVRGDLFWGTGEAAGAAAGAMNATGRYYLLLPGGVAARRAVGGD